MLLFPILPVIVTSWHFLTGNQCVPYVLLICFRWYYQFKFVSSTPYILLFRAKHKHFRLPCPRFLLCMSVLCMGLLLKVILSLIYIDSWWVCHRFPNILKQYDKLLMLCIQIFCLSFCSRKLFRLRILTIFIVTCMSHML